MRDGRSRSCFGMERRRRLSDCVSREIGGFPANSDRLVAAGGNGFHRLGGHNSIADPRQESRVERENRAPAREILNWENPPHDRVAVIKRLGLRHVRRGATWSYRLSGKPSGFKSKKDGRIPCSTSFREPTAQPREGQTASFQRLQIAQKTGATTPICAPPTPCGAKGRRMTMNAQGKTYRTFQLRHMRLSFTSPARPAPAQKAGAKLSAQAVTEMQPLFLRPDASRAVGPRFVHVYFHFFPSLSSPPRLRSSGVMTGWISTEASK